MPHPSLIEWTLDDGRTVVLIFQGKAEPRLEAELRNTTVWPNRCPDDGTLFLEGTPKDYIEMPICLEPPGARPQCILTAALVLDMGGRKTCSFGDVTKGDGGGNGPGFTCNGGRFMHDSCLGVSTMEHVSRQALGTASGVVVLIDRPQQREIRKYFDEDDPSVRKPRSSRSQGAESSRVCGEDIDMGDDNGSQEQSKGPEEDLASKMRTLRLKGN